MPQDELFESPPMPTEEEKKADQIAATVSALSPPLKKKRKPRAPMTAERKAQLLENLRRGRETSAHNRKTKAEARRILKEKRMDEVNEVIRKDVMSKKTTEDLQGEIDRLRAELVAGKAKPEKVMPTEVMPTEVMPTEVMPPEVITFSTFPKSIWS